jgi:hypothetical protein
MGFPVFFVAGLAAKVPPLPAAQRRASCKNRFIIFGLLNNLTLKTAAADAKKVRAKNEVLNIG